MLYVYVHEFVCILKMLLFVLFCMSVCSVSQMRELCVCVCVHVLKNKVVSFVLCLLYCMIMMMMNLYFINREILTAVQYV